jgi:alanyl-tRNA synthetase
LKRGINARQIADQAASVLGGGGSGKPEFAQGGGTQLSKVPEALQKAEETIKKQLEAKK